MVKCILCGAEASRERVSGHDAQYFDCRICGRYQLASPELFEGAVKALPIQKRLMISAITRWLAEKNEEPLLIEDVDNLAGEIEKHYQKNEAAKISSLLMYLKLKSPRFGDEVEYNPDRDFPITSSFSNSGYDTVILAAQEEGLLRLVRKEKPVLILEEQGWKVAESGLRLEEILKTANATEQDPEEEMQKFVGGSPKIKK